MTLAEFWAQCLRRLYSELSETQFQRVIAPLTVGEENGLWIIYAKNQFAVNLLRSQYTEKLQALQAELAPQAPVLTFKMGVGQSYEMAAETESAPTRLAQNPSNSSNSSNLLSKLDILDVFVEHESRSSATASESHVVSDSVSEFKSQPKPKSKLDLDLNNLDKNSDKNQIATEKSATNISHSENPTRKRSAKEILAERIHHLNNEKLNKNKELNHSEKSEKESSANETVTKNKKPLSAIEQAKVKEEIELRHQQTNLSPEYTFDTLVEGKGNHLAAAVAKSIAEKPGDSMYNPFFVYGSTGLGKTHLVQAIGNELLKFNPKAKVRYMHSDEYLKTFMATVRNKTWDAFKQQYLHYNLLIIDDIQFIQGKDRTMEEFFFLFEHFHSRNQQIILTCDQLPSSLENMEKRLISRFSWGMTIKLEPPELEMRIDILERKAQAAGIVLLEDAALFIAQNVKQNVRELEGALNRVLARCRFEKRSTIDIDLATDALQDIVASNYKPITIELIMKAVADYHHIRMSDLLGKKRTRNIARPRQMAMALAKELTNMSLPAIGDAFGGRDHTTVMHAVKTITQLRVEEPELGQDYEKLLILIRN